MRYLIHNGTAGNVRIFSNKVRRGQERTLELATDPRPYYRNKGLVITLLLDEPSPEPEPEPPAPAEVVENPETESSPEPTPEVEPAIPEEPTAPAAEPPLDPELETSPEPADAEAPPEPDPEPETPATKKSRTSRRKTTRSSKKG